MTEKILVSRNKIKCRYIFTLHYMKTKKLFMYTHFERKASKRVARPRRRRSPTNEVSGTRSITLDLFPSPYLRQTFTLFTTLLRARSGQLSFVERS